MRDIFDIVHAVELIQCYYADAPSESDSGNLSSNEEKLDIKIVAGAVTIKDCENHIGAKFYDCMITDNYYNHLVRLHDWKRGKLDENALETEIYCLHGGLQKELSTKLKGLSNYYGALAIKREGCNYYWAVECQVNNTNWVVIPKILFDVI